MEDCRRRKKPGKDGKPIELHNEGGFGHLLRQKLLGVDEGGVAAGFAVLSSPALVGEPSAMGPDVAKLLGSRV